METDILAEIEELLREPSEYDPAAPGMDDRWIRLCRAPEGTTAQTSEPPGPTEPNRQVPRVGTIIQRSDATNRRKLAGLMAIPPPVPRRIRAPTATQPTRPSLQPARVVGPLPPPPISVEVEKGTVVEVPFYAAHVSRKYTARMANRRWIIRFNANGQVRSCREK